MRLIFICVLLISQNSLFAQDSNVIEGYISDSINEKYIKSISIIGALVKNENTGDWTISNYGGFRLKKPGTDSISLSIKHPKFDFETKLSTVNTNSLKIRGKLSERHKPDPTTWRLVIRENYHPGGGSSTYYLDTSGLYFQQMSFLDEKYKLYVTLPDSAYTTLTYLTGQIIDSLNLDDYYNNYVDDGVDYDIELLRNGVYREIRIHYIYLKQMEDLCNYINHYLPEKYNIQYTRFSSYDE